MITNVIERNTLDLNLILNFPVLLFQSELIKDSMHSVHTSASAFSVMGQVIKLVIVERIFADMFKNAAFKSL